MLDQEPTLRLAFFVGVLCLLLIIEFLLPKRNLTHRRKHRWMTNTALVVLNTLVLRLAVPLGAVAFAAGNSWGLLHWFEMPHVLEILIAIIILDLIIYAQHILFHKVPLLWRLHRVHHSDTELDVTTGVRFHTVEICLSLALKFCAILVLGASPQAVLLFEIILSTTALFSHSNIAIPQALEKKLRMILVTPDMHRVHHSVYQIETDSNFGFSTSVWDRLFKTYRPQPKDGHLEMKIGLNAFRDARAQKLDQLLIQPVKNIPD